MINAMKVSSEDNVVVAIESIKSGDIVRYKNSDGSTSEIKALDDIKIYHKIADVKIPKGSFIIKYGEHIGMAGEDIEIGMHVHNHNVIDYRENLERRE